MKVRPYQNLYIHVPFCNGKCAYCAFYSEPEVKQEAVDAWLCRLELDAKQYAPQSVPLNTVYLGGGTPTAIPPESLERIFKIIGTYFTLAENAEISTECNPESLTEEKAAVLGRCVNRVSMGVQSFNPKFRSLIGRRGGGAGTVERALDLLRSNGIANIGFDLIYALPEQTLDDWVRELETSLGYMPRHISAYSLIIEDGTELAARDFPPEDNELSFRMWQTAQEFLGAHGMPRYEISNYAAEKYECRHNQNVWHGETYLGLGPGACSFDGAVRRTEVPSLARWLKGDAAEQDIIEERKRLSEIFIMGLRTVRGWKKSEFSQFSVLSWREMWSKIIEKQISDGMLKESPDCISPTEKGLAFWNDLAEAYF